MGLGSTARPFHRPGHAPSARALFAAGRSEKRFDSEKLAEAPTVNAPKVKLELAALARRRDPARAATQERVPRSSHEEDHTIRSPGLADRRAGTLPTFRRIVVRMVLLGLFPALLVGALLLAGPYESQRLRATEVAMARESAPSYWLADDAAPPQTLSRIPVLWLLPGYLLMLWSCLQICALVREALAPSRLRAFATVRTEDTRRATLVFVEHMGRHFSPD